MKSNYTPSLVNQYSHYVKHFKEKKIFIDELSYILN